MSFARYFVIADCFPPDQSKDMMLMRVPCGLPGTSKSQWVKKTVFQFLLIHLLHSLDDVKINGNTLLESQVCGYKACKELQLLIIQSETLVLEITHK